MRYRHQFYRCLPRGIEDKEWRLSGEAIIPPGAASSWRVVRYAEPLAANSGVGKINEQVTHGDAEGPKGGRSSPAWFERGSVLRQF